MERPDFFTLKNGAENITKFPFGPEHNIIKGQDE